MSRDFLNIKVGYVPNTEVQINDKKYIIRDVIDGEDIRVNDKDLKYPKLEKITKPSIHRISNGCQYQSICGGCQFMHTTYEYELEKKNEFLNDLFKPFHVNKINIVPSDDAYGYRNKAIMTYKLSKAKNVVCGLYEEYTHNIITIDSCMLHSKEANEIVKCLNKALTKHKIMPYDEKTRSGIIRHVYIRFGFNTKQSMMVLVTNGEMFPGRNNVITEFKKLYPNITTIVQNYNARDTSIVLGDKERVLYGPGFIYEKVGDYKFKISPKSFFQINTNGMKKLYDLALLKAGITKNDTVIDAYCGVGTISIFASKYAKEVIGVELNKQAIFDAKINQKINNIKNIEFIADDATNFMTHLAKDRAKIDVVLMDPPREGSTKQFISAIGHLKPKKVVYISCDPKTLKRDLYLFSEEGYEIKSIDAVDMFPRTIHVETVCSLVKK